MAMPVEQQVQQQQVHQELQRLNEAITMTMDAIRRVLPQLQSLQQVQLPFGPLPAYGQPTVPTGFAGSIGTFGVGQPWAPWSQPVPSAYAQPSPFGYAQPSPFGVPYAAPIQFGFGAPSIDPLYAHALRQVMA